MATKAPWKRKNPKKRHTKLTKTSKASARARARRAGRTYPSLVDNMNAAKRQKTASHKKATSTSKKKSTSTSSKKVKRS